MKRTIKLAVVAALALGATSAFATNGSTMMGIGAKSRGMGGVGIATGMGAESAINNPALITSIKGDNQVSFGGTIFMPEIKTNNDLSNFGGNNETLDSDADFFVIPSVSLASKINDNWYWGIGMWGTGGLGVDFRDDALDSNMKMVTALQTMQFGVPIAYTANNFSIGITPIIQYSSIDIDYQEPSFFAAAMNTKPTGTGVAQDIALGFNLGLSYEIEGLTIGAIYKSEIKFDVKDVMSDNINPMLDGALAGGTTNYYTQDEMATPAEYGIGLSYTMGEHTLAVDYKNINWEDAEVYQDFGWEDQDVIAIGYEYATDGWAVRAGYQYAESAVQDNAGKNLLLDQQFQSAFGLTGIPATANLTNTFNLLGFPGTQESHISLGGSYAFNETLSMDVAAVFGLENTETMENFIGGQTTVDHSEQSYSVQINYAF